MPENTGSCWANSLGLASMVSSLSQQARPNLDVRPSKSTSVRMPIAGRDVYLRLLDHGITQIRSYHVPRLLRYDNELWVIDMEIVT